jgi:hypothetical protein
MKQEIFIPEVYFDDKTKEYIIQDNDEFFCDVCFRPIIKEGMLRVSQNNKALKKIFMCNFCSSKIAQFIDINFISKRYNIIDYRIVDIIPKNAFPVLDFSIDLKNSYNSDGTLKNTFEPNTIKSDITIDNTKLAGRESWEGCNIGRDVTQEIEKKDNSQLCTDDVINNILKAVPYKEDQQIEHKETKRITNG